MTQQTITATELPEREGAQSTPELAEYREDRARWFIRIRWAAIGVAAVALAATGPTGALHDPEALWVIVGFAAAANMSFEVLRRRWRGGRAETLITAQVVADLVFLSQILYWGGGADSPFGIFFVFPMAVAGMLLPVRRAMALGVLSVLLHGGTLLAELSGLIPHRPLDLGNHAYHDTLSGAELWQAPQYVAAYIGALAVAELGIAWFVSTVVQRLRESEARQREHERVARSRERLARIGSLAAGVAHTVRNPLHGLVNCVDMLRARAEDDPETEEILELMHDGVERIERVTCRLLALTREGEPRLRMADPRLLVEDSLRFVLLRASERDVSLETELGLAEDLAMDVDRLTEALANVLDNAIQASAEGAVVRVRMRQKRENGSSDMLALEVEDEGVGIPHAEQERIFDPFFTTKPVEEGSGLGLAIARRVVEEHEGMIRVDSEPGGGTRVRIEIPYSLELAT